MDKIIKFHSVTLNVSIIIAASYYYLNNWGNSPTKNYIGSFGCQFVAFNFYFVGCVVQSQSFFIALYRYICIVHTDLLTNIGLNGKVSTFEYIHLYQPFHLYGITDPCQHCHRRWNSICIVFWIGTCHSVISGRRLRCELLSWQTRGLFWFRLFPLRRCFSSKIILLNRWLHR